MKAQSLKRPKSAFSTQALAEAGVMIALATLLSFVKVFHMPQGGSVTAASMVPIVIVALRWGPQVGLLTAAAYGMVQYIVEPFAVHPVQVLLDYPLAFGMLGLAGFLRNLPAAGAALGVAGRFASHVIAGAVFFGTYAPAGQSPWVYSALYNGPYLLAELGITAVVVWALARSGVLLAALNREG
jgi:thiamine transporter